MNIRQAILNPLLERSIILNVTAERDGRTSVHTVYVPGTNHGRGGMSLSDC